jgi:hypothetical protein
MRLVTLLLGPIVQTHFWGVEILTIGAHVHTASATVLQLFVLPDNYRKGCGREVFQLIQ